MNNNLKACAALAFVAIAFSSKEASATRSARRAAVSGFPLPNPGLGNTTPPGSLADGFACFSTTAFSSSVGAGNGGIYLSSTCRGSSDAIWAMPLPTEVRGASSTINGYIVTTGSPTVFMDVFAYSGIFSTGSGSVTATSAQTALSATLVVGGYANIYASLTTGTNQSVVDYAYEYDF